MCLTIKHANKMREFTQLSVQILAPGVGERNAWPKMCLPSNRKQYRRTHAARDEGNVPASCCSTFVHFGSASNVAAADVRLAWHCYHSVGDGLSNVARHRRAPLQ